MADRLTEGQGADRPRAFEANVGEAAEEMVISLGGELDAATVPQFLGTVTDVIDGGRPDITLDLGELTFIDTTGLGALVGSLKRAREAGGGLRLRNPRPSAHRALEIAGLTKVFEIEDIIDSGAALEDD